MAFMTRRLLGRALRDYAASMASMLGVVTIAALLMTMPQLSNGGLIARAGIAGAFLFLVALFAAFSLSGPYRMAYRNV
jgi:hypothetical protein